MSAMELRHLRYFLVVGEVLNFTKAAARLHVAQPALSRQVRDLEEEIGVDLLRRSPRGVILTAEGKLFLEEVRELLKHADESVERVRALARGEYGELHIGYIPIPTVEILPPAIEAFRKAAPHVKLVLHDLPTDQLITELRNATLELAILVQPISEQMVGIEFETLRNHGAWQSGMLMMPTAAAAMGMKLISTRVLGLFGFRRVLIVNTLMIGLTICLYALVTAQTPLAAII